MTGRLDSPRQAVMGVDHLNEDDAARIALRAARFARLYLPRVTGGAAATLTAIWGPEWFGVEWTHDSVWFMEAGTRPFTMRSLAGKTIPMWVNDQDGNERRRNPNARTRMTQDGRNQVLIFRKAAVIGARRNEWRNIGGRMVYRSYPASYPGAPGRIAVNRSQGLLRAGDIDPQARNRGQIARRNVGVRWRHPGLDAGRHIMRGMADAATEAHIPIGRVRYLPSSSIPVGQSLDIIVARR